MLPGWTELTEALATARSEMQALAPDTATAEEGEAYLLRVLTSSLAEALLGNVLTENGLTMALPTRGGSNPDYRMLAAAIDPARRYRIEGRLNESERVALGLYAIRPDGAALLSGYREFTAANLDPEGRFALDMAAGAQERDGLSIAPDVRQMIIRVLHRSAGVPAHMTLTGGGGPSGLSLATGSSEGALRQVGQSLLRTVRQFLVWTRTAAVRPNWIGAPSDELGDTVTGTPDVRYGIGYYDLQPGEWLEVLMPEAVHGYWNLQALNHWLETLPGASANDRTVRPDRKGRIRLGIGPALPPAILNPIDTCGRQRGVLICRLPAGQELAYPLVMLRKGEK